MKVQRNTIYIVSIIAIISFFLSYTFNCIGTTYSFLSNLFLNVFGGTVLALILAVIAYLIEKNDNLEQFYKSFRKLHKICTTINADSTIEFYVNWFEEYHNAVDTLSFSWSKVAFLLDYHKHRKYMKSILDYYCDFILLTQNQFRLLNESINDVAKKSIQDEINQYLFETINYDHGILQSKVIHNRLTHPMIIHNNNIYNIYIGKANKEYVFTQCLFSDDNFKILSKSEEESIKQIIKESEKTGSAEVIINVKEESLKVLKQNKYINNYSPCENGTFRVSCEFILFHYFDIKKRITSKSTPEYESFMLNIVTLTLSICFIIKQVWNIFFAPVSNSPKSIAVIISLFLMILIYIALSLINRLWKHRSQKSIQIISELGTNFTWLSILFYYVSDILPEFQNRTYLISGFVVCIFLSILNLFFAIARKR